MPNCPVCDQPTTGTVCQRCGFDFSMDYANHPTLSPLPASVLNRIRQPVAPMASLGSLDAALSEIVKRFGVDVLRNGTRTVAIFSGLAPHLPKERLLLTYLTQFGCNERLFEARNLPRDKREAAYRKVVQHLTEEQFIAQAAAEKVCRAFLNAMGPAAAPDTAANAQPSAPAQKPSAKVKDYDSYLRLLLDYYRKNGSVRLSAQQIQDFISDNNLDADWRITSLDVKKDLATIYSTCAAHTPAQPKPTVIQTYKGYMDALEKRYLDNGKQMLSDAQIREFLSSNSLDTRFGISVFDVENDLKTIAEKHKHYQSLTNVLQKKETQIKTTLTGLLRRHTSRK